MPGDRDNTPPPVIVNVTPSKATTDLPKRKNGSSIVTIAAVGAIVGIVISGVGFFAQYVFATKADVRTHERTTSAEIHALDTEQKITDASVKAIREDLKEFKVEQRVTNKNLDKLLRRSRIVPASRSDIRIEMEEEEDE